jgi:glycosyltransferase involved in cell wall biosynthesis
MKILFITGHKYFPLTYGGVQSSTDQLCRGLMEKGHRVAVLAGFSHGGWFAFKARLKIKINSTLNHCGVCRDTQFGYPVWMSWFPWDAVNFVVRREKPDLIVVLSGLIARMGLAAKPLNLPTVLNVHDVAFYQLGGEFDGLRHFPCIANSRFTAEKYRSAYGIDATVIYPFFAPDQYKTDTTRENVTFINPHPEKGRDIAIKIAQLCPEIPFTFIEGWKLSEQHRRELTDQLAALPRVTFVPSQRDMRKIYGKCKILLAPSVVEEAFGRVATQGPRERHSGCCVNARRVAGSRWPRRRVARS